MSRVLVTGATGFVGTSLIPVLKQRGYLVRAAVRDGDAPLAAGVERVVVGDLGPETSWTIALSGVSAVVHLAARVHVMRDRADDPLAAFRRVNVDGTRHLGEACLRAGVGRLIFVSSIKAQTEATGATPAGDDDPATPDSPYGRSKLEAEAALAALATPRGLAVGILRPPLLYGPGVKGNFLRLMTLLHRGVPLPLGAVRNRRSLLHVGNLADAIAALLAGEAPAPRPYLIHDGPPLSTPALIRTLAIGLGRPARLPAVPPWLIGGAMRALGKGEAWRRLSGSLVVDDSRLRRERRWTPPVRPEDGLMETTRWFKTR